MILERSDPFPHQPSLHSRPELFADRGGLEHDRFFPKQLVNPSRELDVASVDAARMMESFRPRWWLAPTNWER